MKYDKQHKLISLNKIIIMLSIILILCNSVVAEESTTSSSSPINLGTTFMTECATGVSQKQNTDWTKIYDNGFGTKIKIVATNELIDDSGYNINKARYNKDLTENDVAIIYSRITRSVNILHGKNINLQKIRQENWELQQSFQTNPCDGFKQFIEKASKEKIIDSTKTSSTTKTPAETNTETQKIDCKTEFEKAEQNLAEFRKYAKNGENIGLENFKESMLRSYRDVYNSNCQLTIYGARAALKLGSLYLNQNIDTAEEWYMNAHTASNNFPEIAREALYNIIIIEKNKGDCDKLIPYLSIYKEKFSGQSTKYDERIKSIAEECGEITQLQKKCKSLYSVTPGRKNDIVLIADGYTDIDAFKSDVTRLIERGFFDETFMQAYQNKFNIYYVDNLYTEICKNDNYDRKIAGKACDSKKSIDISRACPSIMSIILSQKGFTSYAKYGTEAYISMTDGRDTEKIFKHELGHTVFKLADEYTEYFDDGKSKGDYPKEPNCFNTKAEAKTYWENTLHLVEGKDFSYYEGCAYTDDNIRGTKNSIMRDAEKYPEFGPINEVHIKRFMSNYD